MKTTELLTPADTKAYTIEAETAAGAMGFAIREVPMEELNRDLPADKLPGVLVKGIQYYDLQHIGFITNTGIADLITLMKMLLKQGVEARFVNVNERIMGRIKAMGLDGIIPCS